MEKRNVLAIGMVLMVGGGLLTYFFGFTAAANSEEFSGLTIVFPNIFAWVGFALVVIGFFLTFWALFRMMIG